MRKQLLYVYTLLPVLVAGTYSEILRSETDSIDQQKLISNLIIDMFLLNVDKGKLIIFGYKIKRSQITSKQVSYTYDLDEDSLSISIHLQLNEHILVPHFQNYHVNEISVDVDADGNIQQIKSHVIPYE